MPDICPDSFGSSSLPNTAIRPTPAPAGRCAELSGLQFQTGNISELTDTLLIWLEENTTSQSTASSNRLITYINPHVYNVSMCEDDVWCCLQQSDRVCIDGVGIKLVLLMLKRKPLPRVVAEHLFNRFVERLKRPVSALLIGAEPGDAVAAARSLSACNPNLNILASLDGFAGLAQARALFRDNPSASLILIGAGTPKSESLALLANEVCRGTVIFHMGAGTLKTWAGTKRRGPALMSTLGLEWLHRIVFESHTRSRYTRGAFTFAGNLISGSRRDARQIDVKQDTSQ